jgi:hypothetical protein
MRWNKTNGLTCNALPAQDRFDIATCAKKQVRVILYLQEVQA